MSAAGRWSGSTGKGTVLLVDDEEPVRRVVARLLEKDGQQVVQVASGTAALEALAARTVDLVVTDIQMPGMSGLQLLRAIRERDLDVPVVLVTGVPTLETAVEAIGEGVFDYVQKPTFDRLVETAGRAIGLGRLARAKRAAIEAATGHKSGAADVAGLDGAFGRAMDSLWPAYQPILDREGRTYGHEALMRSKEPSLPHPGAVLDAAERLGRLDELGMRMRDISAGPVRDAEGAGFLFVNLHPRDLEHPGLLEPSAALVGIASRVVLEITERASLTGLSDVRRRVAELRACGYRIAVDDLGAGYAGLTSFALLEPEVVKLDMTLIRDVDTSATKQKVIASFTALSHDLGMLVVAEGIETRAELAKARELGCDLFQGFALARPGPAFPGTSWPLAQA